MLTEMGLNDRFVDEVVDVLRCFPRITPSLRNAAVRCVAERHSIYIGADEVPARAIDLARVRRSPFLHDPYPPNPHNYVRRLAARMGLPEVLPDAYDVLDRFTEVYPLADAACAALVIAHEQLDLTLLAFCLNISEVTVARIVARAAHIPFAEVVAILRPTRRPRPRSPPPPPLTPITLNVQPS